MTNILAFFAGWQVKLLLVAALLFGAWAWHAKEVSVAVSKAEQRIELQYAREVFKLKDRANTESILLKQKIEKQKETTDAKIKAANAKYDLLNVWLQSQPGSNSNNGVSGDSTTASNPGRTYFGGLYREDALALAESSNSAEQLKLRLLACHQQYNEVQQSLEDFRLKNSLKTH